MNLPPSPRACSHLHFQWLGTRWLIRRGTYRVPGTMDVHGASVQILDLPGIIEGAKDGKGRGRQVIAGQSASSRERFAGRADACSATVARTCNLIFIVLDVLKPLGDKAVRSLRSLRTRPRSLTLNMSRADH